MVGTDRLRPGLLIDIELDGPRQRRASVRIDGDTGNPDDRLTRFDSDP